MKKRSIEDEKKKKENSACEIAYVCRRTPVIIPFRTPHENGTKNAIAIKISFLAIRLRAFAKVSTTDSGTSFSECLRKHRESP